MKKKSILRRISAVGLAAVMCAFQIATTFGAAVSVNVDGSAIDFGTSEAVIEDGATYVPIRAVFESFGNGTTVDWDEEEKAVKITCNGETLVLYTSTGEVVYKGETTKLENNPIIIDGRTLLPLRELVEMLGGSVEWDAETKTVDVKSTKTSETSTYDVVIPSGIKDEVAEEIKTIAGKPLPEGLYLAFESDYTYGKEELELICSLADCKGYYVLEQDAKKIFDTESLYELDWDTIRALSNKFAYEYITALFKCEDKSFVKNPVYYAVVTDDTIVADSSVSVRETAEKISYAMDNKNGKIKVNPNMELLARCIYAFGKLNKDITSGDAHNYAALSMVVQCVNYLLDENPGWKSMLPEDVDKIMQNQIKSDESVEELAGVPLPRALYEGMGDGWNSYVNIKRILEIADSTGYEELKKNTKEVSDILNGNTDYEDCDPDSLSRFYKYYVEGLASLEDKSFMSGVMADVFKDGICETNTSYSINDMIRSIDKHKENPKEKIKANPKLELFARVLSVLSDNADNEVKDENTSELKKLYMLIYYITSETAENDLLKDNEALGDYVIDIWLSFMHI